MPQKKAGPRIERRRSARANASLSMRVEGRPTDGELTKIVTESQNISASGVYCMSPHYLAPLSKVALTIVLPSQATRIRPGPATGAQRLLKCDGIVVRCLPADPGPRRHAYELACSFLGLDERHRGLIEEFVSWRNLEAMRMASQAGARTRRSAPTARPVASRPAGHPTKAGRAAPAATRRPRRKAAAKPAPGTRGRRVPSR